MSDVTVDIDGVAEAVKRHLKQALSGDKTVDFASSVTTLKALADRVAICLYASNLNIDQKTEQACRTMSKMYRDVEQAATHALIIAILLRTQIKIDTLQSDIANAQATTKH
ncbi:hypothetical protein AZ09_04330 [Acetobacter aceti 1023]|nr:hypothetical protein AZ09_04330 [Acetobacter aceti 1023]